MTGLHLLHVLVGALLLLWVMVRTAKGNFSSKYYLPVDLVGLYWHFVGMVWIFMFPLLYLIA
jgi:cytochrome c oxidase subunit 3